jgi:predicted DNA-binding ribbon-helix-helix protein
MFCIGPGCRNRARLLVLSFPEDGTPEKNSATYLTARYDMYMCSAMSASRLVNRNVLSERGRTSVTLEPEFWDALRDIARFEDCELSELVKRAEKLGGTRTSAIRVFVLGWFRGHLTQVGRIEMESANG